MNFLDNLSRLKLIRAAEVLGTVAEQAKENKSSYFAFLDHLLEEVAAKETRRIQTAMRTAGLPGAKSIEEYDFSFHPLNWTKGRSWNSLISRLSRKKKMSYFSAHQVSAIMPSFYCNYLQGKRLDSVDLYL